MPSRIEQALDQLASVATGRVIPWPAILAALRAAAELQTAAISARNGSTSHVEQASRTAGRDRAITGLGAALDALATSVLGEEVPTDEH